MISDPEAEKPTDPGVDAAPPVEEDPPPRWVPRQHHHTPSAALGGMPSIPNWATNAMYYWYIVVPLLVGVCSGICAGALVGVWWLAERVINAWIIS